MSGLKYRLRLIKKRNTSYVVRFMACVGLAYDGGPLCDPWAVPQQHPILAAAPNAPTLPPPPLPNHNMGRGGGMRQGQTADHVQA